ncbi:hypothetical protein HDU76_008787 [Blyttiomyces sp. JEL0837]|nr:hypothetical protein HDU76_008787 [Blyttiomyces sp. JEL0837]
MDDRFNQAVTAYKTAIEIAESLIHLEHDTVKRRGLQAVLANRVSNLGVLWKDVSTPAQPVPTQAHVAANSDRDRTFLLPPKGHLFASPSSLSSSSSSITLTSTPSIAFSGTQQRAKDLFMRSLDLHRAVDNLEGIAQVSGNIGQLYLDVNNVHEAATYIRDGYDIIVQSATTNGMDPIAMQYACMNMGYLADRQGRPSEAVTFYLYVLQRIDVIVSYVQRTCAFELIRLCEETDLTKGVNRPDLARSVRAVAEPIFGYWDTSNGSNVVKQKDLMLVLDCSGSMAGGFIRACRSSINNILKNFCNPNDSIGLQIFNNTVTTVFPLTTTHPEIIPYLIHSVETETECNGGTSFFDALNIAIQSMAMTTTTVNASNRESWVIALTDGDDNSSETTPYQLKNLLRANPRVGLMVITVGRLQYETTIREIVDAAGSRGLLINCNQSSEAIRKAFEKVAKVLMTGNLKVETL